MEVSQYLSVFMDECREHLQTLNESLLELEKNPEEQSTMDRIFRSAHTLKGASATMGFNRLSNLTHAMEDVLGKLRSKELKLSSEITATLFKALDLVEVLVNNIGEGHEGDVDTSNVVQDLKKLLFEQPTPQPVVAVSQGNQINLQLRYTEADHAEIAKLTAEGMKLFHVELTIVENCVLKGARTFMILRDLDQIGTVIKSAPSAKDLEDEKFDETFMVAMLANLTREELQSRVANFMDVAKAEVTAPELDKLMEEKRTRENTIIDKSRSAAGSQTVRVDIRKLDELMNLVGELVISRARLEAMGSSLASRELDEVVEQVGRLTIDLRDSVLKVRMMPVETVFSRFPRLVRDLSKELGKDIELEIHGGETELDRTVIDEIGDPMIHIMRNSIDHGIEPVEVRRQNNKSEKGKITLRAYQEGNNVVIMVADDGRGFNVAKVKEKAIKQGLTTPEEVAEMSDDKILEFTFLPGFSTAEKVTDLSGRGVGMDVVRTKVIALGGTISITSKQGEGSTVFIRLPLTMMIIQTLLVEIGKEIYAIPSSYIEQIINLSPREIKMIRNQEVCVFREELLPLLRLQNVLGTSNALNYQLEELDVVVLRVAERQVGCIVDRLLPQRDVVIKSLGGFLGSVKGITGATILGDGRVALILDIREIA